MKRSLIIIMLMAAGSAYGQMPQVPQFPWKARFLPLQTSAMPNTPGSTRTTLSPSGYRRQARKTRSWRRSSFRQLRFR